MTANVFVGIGSNIGDRCHYLQSALNAFNADKHMKLAAVSSIYETDPVGMTDQRRFLNMVAQLETGYSPHDLLDVLLQIERQCGRKRVKLWGPRTLDLDILLYNQENIQSERLHVPHPRLQERGFVLIPLYEIEPQLVISPLKKSIAEMLTELTDKEGVRIWRKKNGAGEFGLFES